jgi:CubicO group peptidase (beta-lactamase class C family)
MRKTTCFLLILLLLPIFSLCASAAREIKEVDLLGDYQLAPDVILSISCSEGGLSAHMSEGEPFALEHRQRNRYSITDINSDIRFKKSKLNGKTSLLLERYGETMKGHKTQKISAARRKKSITSRISEMTPVWMTQFNVPAVSIAIIKGRKITWSQQFGVIRAGEKSRPDEHSVFEACSMSKPLFAYAVMKMVEEGTLELNRTLDSYLSEPYLPHEPDAARITVRMVLNHSTGLPNWRKGGKGALLKLINKPGEKYTYSGEGMWYLQKVVEHITGMPIDKYMKRTVMDHIGMKHSSYVWLDRFNKNGADGHNADGKPKNYNHYTKGNVAYSLYTTPEDYARYLILMMTQKPKKDFQLRTRTLKRMLTLDNDMNKNSLYGLGWRIGEAGGRRYIMHGGSNGSGFRCHARFYPDDGSGIVIMTNGDNGASVYRKVLRQVFPPSIPTTDKQK